MVALLDIKALVEYGNNVKEVLEKRNNGFTLDKKTLSAIEKLNKKY